MVPSYVILVLPVVGFRFFLLICPFKLLRLLKFSRAGAVSAPSERSESEPEPAPRCASLHPSLERPTRYGAASAADGATPSLGPRLLDRRSLDRLERRSLDQLDRLERLQGRPGGAPLA